MHNQRFQPMSQPSGLCPFGRAATEARRWAEKTMHIFHPELAPVESATPYPATAVDVLAFRVNSSESIVQELFQRKNGTFGFRYQAWVNFADAGGNPHHLWQEYSPGANAIVDTQKTVQQLAESHAQECGEAFGLWAEAQQGIKPDVPAFGGSAG